MSELYEELYLHLFNAVTDSLEALSERNYGQAEALLKTAQQRAEERYMQGEAPT
ncbi:MAG: hypothetical protein RRY97_04540 [Oscillibacter sp.]